MNELKHVVLRNQWINGWEYGILRSFENAIAKVTGAEIINYPEIKIPDSILKRFGHGMNKAKYRKLLPKTIFKPEADVLWVMLMGPENFQLDIFEGWQKSAKKKVLYLCDTLPMQMGTVKKLFSNNDFDLCITAFEDAIPQLESITGRKWLGLVQAAPVELFQSSPYEERLIHFSNYGRRFPLFHEALIDFCNNNNLYYDYTTHDVKHPTAKAEELYRQYAWHLSHSLFNVCWSVELTNPQRAGDLRPITARWFEAGLAGSIIIGKSPDNIKFKKQFGEIEELNPFATKEEIFKHLEKLWENRKALFDKRQKLREENKEQWSWNNRVMQILEKL